jgi:hypothetical protein
LDPLDRLTDRLLFEVDGDATAPSPSCLGDHMLGDLVAGRLLPVPRERVEAHLAECLSCLHRLVQLRDDLRAIAIPPPASPRLRRTLDRLLGEPSTAPARERVAAALRGAFRLRVPAWGVAGLAVALVLATWVTTQYVSRAPGRVDWPLPEGTRPDALTPTHRRASGTISGVVKSVRDATSNGVNAHVLSLTDSAGTTYMLFTWGPPTVRAGDAVEIQALFTGMTREGGAPVYQGVVTELRRAP